MSAIDASGRDLLEIGFGKVDITPPVGIGLAGYAVRTGHSQAIGERLYSRALTIKSTDNVVSIVANDLLCIPSFLTEQVRGIIEREVGILGENVMLSATHTHAGPLLEHMSMVEEEIVDNPWIHTVLPQGIAQAVHMAYANMQPATIGAGIARVSGLTYNRRLKRNDGKVEMMYELPRQRAAESMCGLGFTFSDPALVVLSAFDVDRRLIGLTVNYACHPVCNDFDAQSISSDFSGVLARRLEAAIAGICLYVSAPCAEIVPAVRNSAFMAAVLGDEVLLMCEKLEACQGLPVWSRSRKIKLPLKKFPPVVEARRDFEEKMAAGSADRFLARRTLLYAEQYRGVEYLETEVQAIRAGEVLFVGLPGEISVEIGVEIRNNLKMTGLTKVFLVSLANAWTGELMKDKAYVEGGAEVEKTTRLGPGSEEVLAANISALLKTE